MFTEGQTVNITKINSASAFVSVDGEKAVVIDALRIDGDRQMVYVEYPNRPLRRQRNGSFTQKDQLWLSLSA